MPPTSLNLVPPAPFPQPLASDVDDNFPVIVDEADIPANKSTTKEGDDPQVEPLESHPQGVDSGDVGGEKSFHISDEGLIRDSLTLGELRKIVDGPIFKAKKPRQYAFKYSDIDSLKNEIEECFSYKDIKWLEEGMQIFEENHPTPWALSPVDSKLSFIRLQLAQLEAVDENIKQTALTCLLHLVLGVFGEVINSEHQMFWINENVKLLRKCGAFEPIYIVLRAACRWMEDDQDGNEELKLSCFTEVKCCAAILYLMLLVESENNFKDEIFSLEPPFIPWLIRTISLMRSKEPQEQSSRFPKQLTLLLHKSLLLLFGDTTATLQSVKDYARNLLNLPPLDKSKSTITTNPLDYHLFRQEIIAKYPTYTPPPLPIREDLITEPILVTNSEPNTTTTYYDGTGGPVHIATPAPSPPPSPRLKKSIYQTDQTVPLLLPGNGEVPKSIVEAGDLYSQRMRITTATVQMWHEKEKFNLYNKGFLDFEVQETEENKEDIDNEAANILERVEETYRESLPYLQGMVVALLQLLLANISPTPTPTFRDLDDDLRLDGFEDMEQTVIENTREKEILGKAITGILLLMLKWFHVLKFEYLSQLLYDSNYYILCARLLSMDTPVLTIQQVNEIPALGLFSFPFRDSAIPPPIARRRNPQPEVPPDDSDEPPPITDFSWRSIYITTNLLRILQKVVKRKPYRNLQLVQLKLTQLLRKQYKIPNETVVYYVLKLIKGQVPYSGRKWRQPNMRFITSVYMTIRPELREDWLTTGDIEAEVEEAQPQENALRAMTHYYNVRRYPEEMASTGRGELEDVETRWFRRLLEEVSLT